MTATAFALSPTSHPRRRIAGGVSRRSIVEVAAPLAQTRAPAGVDMRRILRVREAIARGTYDAAWRLDEAANRMIRRMLRDQ